MEQYNVDTVEHEILSILIKFNTYNKACKVLYKQFETTTLWKNIFSLSRKKYIELIYDQTADKVIDILIPEKTILNFQNIPICSNLNNLNLMNYSKDVIRFQLKKLNPNSNFKSQFGGIISFRNDITLEAGKKYIYAVFKSENNNLLLTITPENKIIDSAIHTDFEELPFVIQELIKKYLNDLNNDHQIKG